MIRQEDLATTTIADTGVSVATLVDVFLRTQDGRQDREMHDEHGADLGDAVIAVRRAVRGLGGI